MKRDDEGPLEADFALSPYAEIEIDDDGVGDAFCAETETDADGSSESIHVDGDFVAMLPPPIAFATEEVVVEDGDTGEASARSR
jgi:hypothetical protein